MKTNINFKNILFILLLLGISFLYNYHEILFHRPYSIHTWRQADCLSITQNYYKENLNFFTPQVHWIGDKGHGKTISEFPIIYFTVAQLWKIFGQKEFIFRLINVLLVFTGLFSLFKLSGKILKDTFWSYMVPLLLFTSPLLIFYTNNFLSNAPALGLALTGTYLYFLYTEEKSRKWLILSMIVFTFSGLLKITSLLMFMSILSVIVLNGIVEIWKKKETIKNTLLKILPFLCVLTTIAIWFWYARYYNEQNHRNLFLQDIFPIWGLSIEERGKIAHALYSNLIPTFFNKVSLLVVTLIFIGMAFFYKKVDRLYYSILVVLFVGIISYTLLWFKAFDVHDYYLTNLLILIPITLIVFFKLLKEHYSTLYKSVFTKGIFGLILLFLVSQGALKNRLKYDSKKYLKSEYIFIKESERNYWEYVHWDFANRFEAFETITPYLRSLGIKRTDKVICISDESINITLYLMDQKGLTRFGYYSLTDNERINFATEQHCKYLIITDRDLKDRNIDSKYTQHPIGKHKNINIYKLSS